MLVFHEKRVYSTIHTEILVEINTHAHMDLLQDLSSLVRKPAFFICKNKDTDQLCGDCEADQRFCFRYMDSTIPLLSKSKISSLEPSSVADSSVCVGPVQKPCLWFSHEGAHILLTI